MKSNEEYINSIYSKRAAVLRKRRTAVTVFSCCAAAAVAAVIAGSGIKNIKTESSFNTAETVPAVSYSDTLPETAAVEEMLPEAEDELKTQAKASAETSAETGQNCSTLTTASEQTQASTSTAAQSATYPEAAAETVEHIESFSFEEDKNSLPQGATVKDDGFANTSPCSINSGSQASQRAKNELDTAFVGVEVYRDYAENVWKVVFLLPDNTRESVYMSADGITVMTVYGE